MKKIIIAIVITFIFSIYFAVYGFLIIGASEYLALKIIVSIALIGLLMTLVHNLNLRLKELKEEDEDDYRKY